MDHESMTIVGVRCDLPVPHHIHIILLFYIVFYITIHIPIPISH